MGAGRTVGALRESLGMPERTVREAVRWLVESGFATRRPVLGDTRRHWILPVEAS